MEKETKLQALSIKEFLEEVERIVEEIKRDAMFYKTCNISKCLSFTYLDIVEIYLIKDNRRGVRVSFKVFSKFEPLKGAIEALLNAKFKLSTAKDFNIDWAATSLLTRLQEMEQKYYFAIGNEDCNVWFVFNPYPTKQEDGKEDLHQLLIYTEGTEPKEVMTVSSFVFDKDKKLSFERTPSIVLDILESILKDDVLFMNNFNTWFFTGYLAGLQNLRDKLKVKQITERTFYIIAEN